MSTATAMPASTGTNTRHIPCTVEFAPNLRRAIQDYRPEVTWLHITPGTGEILAYAGDTVYAINCAEREGDVGLTEKDVIVGLGFYRHDEVPAQLYNSKAPSHERYSVHKPAGQGESSFHALKP